ncbi:MAG: thiaminase II [Acidimicrobiales bacterium]
MARFTEALREPYDAIWETLLANRFVADMADGTLPPEKFRYYIEQNLQYLPEYAKVLGLGAARATSRAELERFTHSLSQIVDVELDTNRRLRDAIVALGAADHGAATEPSPTCLAYTSYLVATASTGDSLDIMAAILPCAWSYHEIALRHPEPASHPVYSDWLGFFASDEYGTYLKGLLGELDEVVGDVDERDLPRLRRRFLAGARFEAAFWDMAYTMQTWPDAATP